MNIDIFKIIKLLFALIEDTELKDNKTFQVIKQVADAVDGSPSTAVNGERLMVKGSCSEIAGSETPISALGKPELPR